ncbi:type II methionyl aminopeptidase [Candidatus Woesearchaeota archaeon]|nr:type II methionyl aminopeptidase [Candidatus Woesearchaeota archaeon]
MESEILEKYLKAGRIAREALEFGKGLIRKGAKVLDVCNKVEEEIARLGAKPAFPVQIALNDAAAHFCPEDDDSLIFGDQLACLDVGVHVDGYVGDTALTVDLSGAHADLVKASREALNAALEAVKPGVRLALIGKAIEDTIHSFGFQPVRNLSGHGLGQFEVHTPPTIPNFDTKDGKILEGNQVVAIEPFATDGIGLIQEKGSPSVFQLIGKKSVRIGFVRDIQKEIESFQGLPFTTRWLTKKFSKPQVEYAMNQFDQLGILHKYPPLVEKSGGLVSQAEHSVVVDDNVIILT